MIYEEGGLRDTDPASKSSVRFIPANDAELRGREAMAAADIALGALDRAEFDHFLGGTWGLQSSTQEARDRTIANFSAARQKRGYIANRTFVRSVYAEFCPENSASLGDFLLLIREVQSSKGVAGREFTLMGKKDSIWKVIWVDYGCLGPCSDASNSPLGFGR
jgi:hypothetical protein